MTRTAARLLIALASVSLAGEVVAAGSTARPRTTAMSCAAAAGLVRNAGAIVIDTGPDLFDRYVSNEGACTFDTVATPAFVPAADNAQCFIGYTCVRRSVDRN